MNVSDKRDPFFDFLKCFAIFLVINDHFVGSYADEYYRLVPFAQLFDIFYGKFGVSLFSIVSGYFAYRSGKKKGDIGTYASKRYLFFFSSCLVTNILYYLTDMNGLSQRSGIGMVIGEALMLGDFFCPSFWFLKDFLLGSLICFLLGKCDAKFFDCLILTLLVFLCGQTFAASVVIGSLLFHILEKQPHYLGSVLFKIVAFLLLISSAIYRFESSDIRYMFNTIRAMALILLFFDLEPLKKISETKAVSLFGSMTIAILTSHLMVTVLFIKLDLKLPIGLFYLLWLIISLALSVIIHHLIRFLYKNLYDLAAVLVGTVQKKMLDQSDS